MRPILKLSISVVGRAILTISLVQKIGQAKSSWAMVAGWLEAGVKKSERDEFASSASASGLFHGGHAFINTEQRDCLDVMASTSGRYSHGKSCGADIVRHLEDHHPCRGHRKTAQKPNLRPTACRKPVSLSWGFHRRQRPTLLWSWFCHRRKSRCVRWRDIWFLSSWLRR
jgi:hypothetical protein